MNNNELLQVLRETNEFSDFIKDKIIIDAGSGYGEFLSLWLNFNPKKIYSVEMDESKIAFQKDWVVKSLPKRLKRYASLTIEFICDRLQTFIIKNREFDTIIFVESLYELESLYINEYDSYHIKQKTEIKYTKLLFSTIKDKNIIIFQSNITTKKIIRNIRDDDYKSMLYEIGFKNVIIHRFPDNDNELFLLFATP